MISYPHTNATPVLNDLTCEMCLQEILAYNKRLVKVT